jgi:hypothetical protein
MLSVRFENIKKQGMESKTQQCNPISTCRPVIGSGVARNKSVKRHLTKMTRHIPTLMSLFSIDGQDSQRQTSGSNM